MVKRFFSLLFVALSLQAALIQKVQTLLPERTFTQNVSLLRTLFTNEAKYLENGRIDYQKLFLTLERVGVWKEAMGEASKFMLRFKAKERPFLLMRLSEWALERGQIYRYNLMEVEYEEGIGEVFEVEASPTISFAKLLAFLRSNAIFINDIAYMDGGWSMELDLTRARLDLPKVVGSAEFRSVKESLWLDVCGARMVKIHSFGKFWHPFVGVYDGSLRPLDLYKSYSVMKDVRLALPNGACYIKISDIFTPKNIKRGFRISLE